MVKSLLEMGQTLVVALTLMAEAEGEPWAGKVMVAETIVNFAHEKDITLKEACLWKNRYSCWNGEKRQQKLVNRTADGTLINSQAWKDCIEQAKTVCQGNYQPSSRVTRYFNPKKLSEEKVRKLRESLILVAVVANHEFYVEK